MIRSLMRVPGLATVAAVALLLVNACARPGPELRQVPAEEGGALMKITSAAFADGANIPQQYTCDGSNVSPPLNWSDVPPGTQTLALIAEDPDAPAGTFTHWVIFNLPAISEGLPARVPASPASLDRGGQQGTNSWGNVGYGGPCPPSGTHRYYFRLYALDAPLSLSSNATAKDLRAAMEGHLQAETELMGRYGRGR